MRPIPDAPGYLVTDDGRVFSVMTGHRHPPRTEPRQLRTHDSAGYLALKLKVGGQYRKRFVHDLVLTTYVGPRPGGMHCRHLDGDKRNNHVSNLKWGTRSENQMDRVAHGTSNRGERHPLSKYDEGTVRMVRRLVKRNVPRKLVSKMTGIPYQTVVSLANRSAWSWLDA